MLAFSFSSGGGGGAPLVAKQSRERREVVVVRGGGGEALVSPRGGVGVHGEVHRLCDEHLDVLEEFVSLVEPLIGHRVVPLRAMLRVVADDLIAEVDDAVAHAASALRNRLLMILPEEDCAGNPAELHGFELATLAEKLGSLFPHSGDAVVVAMAEDDAENPDGEEEGAVEGGERLDDAEVVDVPVVVLLQVAERVGDFLGVVDAVDGVDEDEDAALVAPLLGQLLHRLQGVHPDLLALALHSGENHPHPALALYSDELDGELWKCGTSGAGDFGRRWFREEEDAVYIDRQTDRRGRRERGWAVMNIFKIRE